MADSQATKKIIKLSKEQIENIFKMFNGKNVSKDKNNTTQLQQH